MLARLAKVGDGKCGKQNACRASHRLVEHAGVTLRLKMDAISIVVKRAKPLGTHRVWWPCITMQEWTSYLLCNHAQVLLAGHRLDETTSWKAVFLRFWSSYKRVDPGHPVFSSNLPLDQSIPYAYHGDEGRGKGRDPFMVISFQPIVSHLGLDSCNDST